MLFKYTSGNSRRLSSASSTSSSSSSVIHLADSDNDSPVETSKHFPSPAELSSDEHSAERQRREDIDADLAVELDRIDSAVDVKSSKDKEEKVARVGELGAVSTSDLEGDDQASSWTAYPPLGITYEHPRPWLEGFAVTLWLSMLPFFLLAVPLCVTLGALFWPKLVLPLIVAYVVYVFTLGGYGDELRGAWTKKYLIAHWLAYSPLWNYFRSYFEARLIKTANLPSDKNYIFCTHPHGLYVLGTFANMLGNQSLMEEVFPNLSFHSATLPINFSIPIWREILLSFGIISSDSKSIQNLFNLRHHRSGSQALFLITGGTEEFLHMRPGTIDLVLLKRKGFAKMAIKTGASLVPVLTFGENELFEPVHGKWVDALNWFAKKLGGFAVPVLKGRGWGGFMPKRAALVTVVGAPLRVERSEHPSSEQVEELHSRYLKALVALYEEHKDQFFADRLKDMEFVK